LRSARGTVLRGARTCCSHLGSLSAASPDYARWPCARCPDLVCRSALRVQPLLFEWICHHRRPSRPQPRGRAPRRVGLVRGTGRAAPGRRRRASGHRLPCRRPALAPRRRSTSAPALLRPRRERHRRRRGAEAAVARRAGERGARRATRDSWPRSTSTCPSPARAAS